MHLKAAASDGAVRQPGQFEQCLKCGKPPCCAGASRPRHNCRKEQVGSVNLHKRNPSAMGRHGPSAAATIMCRRQQCTIWASSLLALLALSASLARAATAPNFVIRQRARQQLQQVGV